MSECNYFVRLERAIFRSAESWSFSPRNAPLRVLSLLSDIWKSNQPDSLQRQKCAHIGTVLDLSACFTSILWFSMTLFKGPASGRWVMHNNSFIFRTNPPFVQMFHKMSASGTFRDPIDEIVFIWSYETRTFSITSPKARNWCTTLEGAINF